MLTDNLKGNKYSKLTTEAGKAHRNKFTTEVKEKLITEWEQETGQVWPKYTEQVLSKNGTVLRDVGDHYDAHHIIENIYEGPHEWWNLHPAKFPSEHQGGIHRSGGVLKDIMERH